MKNILIRTNILQYVARHWFNISLVLLIAFLFLQKDFSFNLKLSGPPTSSGKIKKNSKVAPLPHSPTDSKQKLSSTEEKITGIQKSGLLEQLPELPAYSKSSAEFSSPLEQLRMLGEGKILNFLDRFGNVAANEMKKYHIPASIILAQAMLASRAGTSSLSESANNYFALKCEDSWTASSLKKSGECFRKYDTAWNAFRDHSLFIHDGSFAHLIKLDPEDYMRWAKGLEMSGYSGLPGYGQLLIDTIREYQLDRFDRL